MLTNKELLKEILQEIKDSELRVLAKVEIKFSETEQRLDDRAKQYNSDILTRFDTWAGELDQARIDRELTSAKINDHDKRLKKLEKN